MTTTTPTPEALYERDDWWAPGVRQFASLRSVSTFRVELLREWLGDDWRGRTVFDLGCGGGFLAVPLAQRGARVVGVDLARRALGAARRQLPDGTFAGVVGDLAAPPLRPGTADVVLLSDVLEHVADPAGVVAAAAELLRPGGHLFANTISRTARSRWLAILAAEGLGFVPRGTHHWELFVRPEELRAMAEAAGLTLVNGCGEAPIWWRTLRSHTIALRKSRSMALGYALLFAKADL